MEELIEAFGPDILDPSGDVSRQKTRRDRVC